MKNLEIPIYEVDISEYNIKKRPVYKKIGKKLDEVIKKHFLGKNAAIRVLSSIEHKDKSVDELIKIIKKTGTDRYDSKKKGDRYENIEGKKIDLFAWPVKVNSSFEVMRLFIRAMYRWPQKYRKGSIRIDIIVLYDPSKLKRVYYKHTYKRKILSDGFVFKYPDKKSEAILGIIKVN